MKAVGRLLGVFLAVSGAGCEQTFDAGRTATGLLPVDERNPILLVNDSAKENWMGEYALLLANSGGPPLVGIVVGKSSPWPDVTANAVDWAAMLGRASESRMRIVPTLTKSDSPTLKRPASGNIDLTVPNGSDGANAILSAVATHSLPYRPLVIATGTRLTDVADAYLMDRTIVDKVVVVSSLGRLTDPGASMAEPNGEMDPWADTIVTSRLRYVQVSAFYDQKTDVLGSQVASLPIHPFGQWIAGKQPGIWDLPVSADQVAVAAVGIPGFATKVARVAPVGPTGSGATAGPELRIDDNGPGWLVQEVSGGFATARFWQALTDSRTYKN